MRGLSGEVLSFADSVHDPSALTRMVSTKSILVIPDTVQDHAHDVIGSLYVLDTGPLQITEKQKEMLLWIAEVVITAIGLQKAVPPLGPILEIGI